MLCFLLKSGEQIHLQSVNAKTLGQKESRSEKNKVYLLIMIEALLNHTSKLCNVDRALEYQCSWLSWTHQIYHLAKSVTTVP